MAYTCCHKNFNFFKWMLKINFLNNFINEVYVKQPSGFKNYISPYLVSKLTKVLYGFKQAPRTLYKRLNDFLIEKDFSKEKIDTIYFIKHENDDIMLIQIYVNDIILVLVIKMCAKFLLKVCRNNLK